MFTAIGLFLKTKLFSGTGLIVTIFGLIFAVFLFSNSNVILSKLGFETTTTLKSDLTKTQGELKTATDINKNLNTQLEKKIENSETKEEVLVESFEEREAVKNTIATVNKNRDTKVKQPKVTLEKETTVTEDVIKIPAKAYNETSEANITSLHETYNKLFKQTEKNDA